MRTTATHNEHDTTPAAGLFMACERREKTWQLGCTTGPGQQPRERTVAARDQARVLPASAQATRRVERPDTAPVVRGDDAGRAGCWRQRLLQTQGRTNSVGEASSLAVHRRPRRATSAGWDVRPVLRLLMRYESGERQVWRVGPVPSVAAEDQRHRHRALETLPQARASTTTRRKGVRRSQGIRLTSLPKLPDPLDALRRWAGSPLPRGRRRRVRRG
jgi:transposase